MKMLKGQIIDEEDFLMFVEKNFSNNNNIYQYIESTYSDLNKKNEEGTYSNNT